MSATLGYKAIVRAHRHLADGCEALPLGYCGTGLRYHDGEEHSGSHSPLTTLSPSGARTLTPSVVRTSTRTLACWHTGLIHALSVEASRIGLSVGRSSTHRVAVAIHAHSLDPSGSQSLAQVRYQHGYARARGEHEALGRVSAASEEGALGEQLLGERGCCALSLEDSTRVNT